MTNPQLHAHTSIPPIQLHLAPQGLQSFRSVAEHPHNHVQLFTAIFLTSHTLTINGHTHTPHGPQNTHDFTLLAEILDDDWIYEAACTAILLSTGEDIRQRFIQIDPHILLAKHKPTPMRHIYNLHLFLHTLTTTHKNTTTLTPLIHTHKRTYTCTATDDDGQVCNYNFDTYQKLIIHQTHTKTGNHQQHINALTLCPTNICPCCRSTSST